MIRLRHTDEWVGFLVVAAVLIFLGAMLEAGVLHDWFRPVSHLRIMLPQSGVAGLSVGADVEILGINVGKVGRIVLSPNQQFYADAEIDQQAAGFVRRDSSAVIRRRFGIAGAAYIDISRGTGAALDWSYAVVDANTEREPTETLTTMIHEVRAKVLPALDDIRRTTAAAAVIAEGLRKGEGTLGRLVTDDTLAHQAEQTVLSVREQVAALAPVIAKLDDVVRQADTLMEEAASRKEGVPVLIQHVDVILQSLQGTLRDVSRATPRLPDIARNAANTTADLPVLMTQIQMTAAELEKLLTQLRGSWLLGGGGSEPQPTRLPATRLQP
jgi:phospholipid/cholesterol/gamma-HCH transport system substrate-binding protein